jgi:hypothetical protein
MEAYMKIFESKSNASLAEQQKEQAKKLGLSLDELKALYSGKSCAKYGTKELLHARKVRGGKIVVFNISEKFRGEKISEGRKKKPTQDSSQVNDV